MKKWFQILGWENEKREQENYLKNRSLRAYELFKKNTYKNISKESDGDSSTSKIQRD